MLTGKAAEDRLRTETTFECDLLDTFGPRSPSASAEESRNKTPSHSRIAAKNVTSGEALSHSIHNRGPNRISVEAGRDFPVLWGRGGVVN